MRSRARARYHQSRAIGQPDFRTPEHIVEAAVKALRDGQHGYTPATGIPALREAVARRTLATTGVEVSPDSVLIVPGGKVTMFAAILMFGEPGVDILYPDPGFPIYRSMIEFTGARARSGADTRGQRLRLLGRGNAVADHAGNAALDRQLPGESDRRRDAQAEIDKLVRGLQAWPNVAILSDEIYDVMTYDGEEHVSLLTYPEIRDRLIVLNGFSKTWAMTGWRLGWSVWPETLYDKVRKLAVNCWSCVNAPTQFAGIAAIDGPQDEVSIMMAAFDRRRQMVTELLNTLPGVSCIRPRGAFYAFPNVSGTGRQAKALANALLDQAGVALIGGPDFGVHGEGYIRVSYANSEDNIRKAVERIGGFLAGRNSEPAGSISGNRAL
jgi:aspartate/methionine/tyrosine aminotransferase